MEAQTNKPSGLAAKLAKAMGEIGRVPKRGRNQAQGYSYARADDVAEHTREVLSKVGVAVFADVVENGIREIETKNGKARISTVRVAWTFVDGDTGEARTVHTPGEGMDTGDKGVYKAMTGSLKYALMLGFLIPTGDADPERDADDDEPKPGKTNGNGKSAGDKVREQMRTPAFRKQEAIRALNAMGLDVRAELAHLLGRTFPVGDDIKLQSEAELEKVEAHVTMRRAQSNNERAGAQ